MTYKKTYSPCDECPHSYSKNNQESNMCKICEFNRQQAEIERLKEYPKCVYEYDGDIVDYCLKSPCANYKTAEEIKSEAYKEFAEACKACFPSLSKVFDIILKEMG